MRACGERPVAAVLVAAGLVIGAPIASSAVYPNSRSAEWFQLVKTPSKVALTTASSEASTMAANSARCSAACLRALTSCKIPMTRTTSRSAPARPGQVLAGTAPTEAGALLFARYAFPPNALGYCGPGDPAELLERVHKFVSPASLHVVPVHHGVYNQCEMEGPLIFQFIPIANAMYLRQL